MKHIVFLSTLLMFPLVNAQSLKNFKEVPDGIYKMTLTGSDMDSPIVENVDFCEIKKLTPSKDNDLKCTTTVLLDTVAKSKTKTKCVGKDVKIETEDMQEWVKGKLITLNTTVGGGGWKSTSRSEWTYLSPCKAGR